MSKKTAIIIVSVIIILVGGGLLAWYLYSSKAIPSNNTPTENPGNIFPNNGNTTPTNNTGNENNTEQNNNQTQNSGNATQPVLKELSQRATAGAIALSTSTDMVVVDFLEKGSGNIYEVSPQNNDENRLTNRTIPRLEESVWYKDGTKVIARYADSDGDTIKSYSAYIVPKSTENPDGSLAGTFLNEDIRSIVSNPEKNKIFYLLANSSGSTGIISDFDGTKKTQIFNSSATEWLPEWPNTNTITLTTKPSNGVPGYMFMINTKNGAQTRAISNIKGLTTKTNPTAELAAYSSSDSDGFSFKIYSFKNGEIIDTPVLTLPEKCVWSKLDSTIIYCAVPSYLPPSDYPDSWYKGQVSFSDEIWKIDSDTGAGELLTKLKDTAGKDIDAVNLSLDPKEGYLVFTNKNDFHVWSLKIK